MMQSAGIGMVIFFMIILVAFLADGGVRSMAMRGLRRKGRTAWLTVVALAVGTAVIMSSLSVGDALKGFVVDKAQANLNDVDIVVLSADFFDIEVIDDIKSDRHWDYRFDIMEPAVVIPVVVHNPISGRTVSRATLYGLDPVNCTKIGAFPINGVPDGDPLEDDKLLINKKVAKELSAYRHQTLSVKLDDPSVRMETIFTESGVDEVELEIDEIVENEGMGRLQFSVQDVQPTIFTTIDTINEAMGHEHKANAILLSKDDAHGSRHMAINWLEDELDEALDHTDLHYDMHYVGENEWRVTNDKVFFDQEVGGMLEKRDPAVITSPISVYFVDSLEAQSGKDLSYSTVAGFDPVKDAVFGTFRENGTGGWIRGDLDQGQIGLTNWTAEALGLSVGDSVDIKYSLIDDYFNLVEYHRTFEVAWVVDIFGKANDTDLMPSYPGIEDVESCFDWEPPFEIDQTTIEDEDEEYWQLYKGTPKAYVHIDAARQMWGNDQGNLTLVKVKGLVRPEIETVLDYTATPEDLGMVIVPIRERLIASASAMDIFLEMFISFGTITIIAGMVFVASTFMMMIRERREEIGAMLSVGISRGRLFQFLFAEGLIYSLIAGMIGLFIGWFAAAGLLMGLETVWSNIVGGQSIVEQAFSTAYLSSGTVLVSLGSGLLISLFTLLALTWRASKVSIMEARGHDDAEAKVTVWRRVGHLLMVVGLCLLAAAFYLKDMEGMFGFLGTKGVVFVLWFMALASVTRGGADHRAERMRSVKALVYGSVAFMVTVIGAYVAFREPPFSSLGLFVAEGLFITISLFGIFIPAIWLMPRDSTGTSSTLALSFMKKEAHRTVMTVAVFALIIFSIVSLSVIVEVQNSALSSVAEEQGGGFNVMAETTSALEMDLRTEASRRDSGINMTVPADIVQLKTVGTSGAVCSNMNPQYPPRLIGADDVFIERNRFRVDSSLSGMEGTEAWEELGQKVDGHVPIFVDENTLIIYIGYEVYSGALGHVFSVDGENGPYSLVVAGILAPSVVAGSFVMHERFLEEMFPTTASYKLLFVDTKDKGPAITELEWSLKDHGLDARTVEDIVSENTQAEQGYMGLFQAYLGAGLIIGIVALSVTEIRAVEERRREIGMLRAVGVGRGTVARIFYTEAAVIGILSLLIGIVGGLVLAVTSGPIWGGGSTISIPIVFLAAFACVLMVILLLSSIVPASRASRLTPATILKEE